MGTCTVLGILDALLGRMVAPKEGNFEPTKRVIKYNKVQKALRCSENLNRVFLFPTDRAVWVRRNPLAKNDLVIARLSITTDIPFTLDRIYAWVFYAQVDMRGETTSNYSVGVGIFLTNNH